MKGKKSMQRKTSTSQKQRMESTSVGERVFRTTPYKSFASLLFHEAKFFLPHEVSFTSFCPSLECRSVSDRLDGVVRSLPHGEGKVVYARGAQIMGRRLEEGSKRMKNSCAVLCERQGT